MTEELALIKPSEITHIKEALPFGVGKAEIDALGKRHVHKPPTTTKEFEALKASIAVFRELRGKIADTHKEVKKPYKEECDRLDKEKNTLTDLCLTYEEPLKLLKNTYEEKKAAEKKAKEEAEAKRIAAIQEKINGWSAYLSGIHGKNAEKLRADIQFFDECSASDTFSYEGYEAQADAIKQSTRKALKDALAERERFEAEEARVAEERAALEKERLELEEKKRLQEEELRKIREKEEAKLAAERAAQEAEATRVREEENARLAKQYEELERQKAAAKEAEEKKAKELAEEIAKIEERERIAAEKAEAERQAKIAEEENIRKAAQAKEDRIRSYAPQMLQMLKAIAQDSRDGKAVETTTILNFINEVEGK